MPRRTYEQELKDKFAADRSHKASEIAYEYCKVTAQACLLINGGAATAVIAFLSKENIEPALFHTIPWCLGGYGVGVVFSALMMFSEMMNADYWNYHWYFVVYERDDAEANWSEKVANFFHINFYVCFGLTTLCFLGASVVLAWALHNVVVPVAPASIG